MPERKQGRLDRIMSVVGAVAVVVALGFGGVALLGCSTECAGYDEYCVEVDCCGDLTCRYVEYAGYRCR